MANVELIIKIPEEKYNYVKKQVAEGIDNPLKVYIANGTPLPKGHGRLVDANAILEDPYGNTYKDIDIAETIIEADKAER